MELLLRGTKCNIISKREEWTRKFEHILNSRVSPSERGSIRRSRGQHVDSLPCVRNTHSRLNDDHVAYLADVEDLQRYRKGGKPYGRKRNVGLIKRRDTIDRERDISLPRGHQDDEIDSSLARRKIATPNSSDKEVHLLRISRPIGLESRGRRSSTMRTELPLLSTSKSAALDPSSNELPGDIMIRSSSSASSQKGGRERKVKKTKKKRRVKPSCDEIPEKAQDKLVSKVNDVPSFQKSPFLELREKFIEFSKRKPAKSHPIRINVRNCRQEAILRALETYEIFHPVTNKDLPFDIMWTDRHLTLADFAEIESDQCKINRFLGLNESVSKHTFTRSVNRMKAFFPAYRDIYPDTFLYPEDLNLMNIAIKEGDSRTNKSVYIIKPGHGSQGNGIMLSIGLTNALKAIENVERASSNYIIQRYIDNPLLIDGLKFDLRIYVVLTSINPLRAYLFRDGLARMCTEQYVKPCRANLNDVYMHLTNYSLQKDSENFVDGEENDARGTKRSLEFVRQHLREQRHDVNGIWKRIESIILRALIAIQGQLIVLYKSAFAHQSDMTSNNRCFHILGVDILLDEDCQPWLMEINASPSLTLDAAIDERVKQPLVDEVLRLVSYEFVKRGSLKHDCDENPERYEERYGAYVKKYCPRFKLIQSEVISNYNIFSSPKIISAFIKSCGTRSRNLTMASAKFCGFLRQYGLDRKERGMTRAEMDLLFIELTKRYRMPALTYDMFLEGLLVISKRYYRDNHCTSELEAFLRLMDKIIQNESSTQLG